ncbi:DUF885 domain-containing protein [Pendulispora rubella]|uniref:DUF885 domain-containing protein n=1 Tax=Pendulispora rubella TaxID=2741070 RepID=A0ABZ2LFU1_9BACT
MRAWRYGMACSWLLAVCACGASGPAVKGGATPAAASRIDGTARSNENAKVLLDLEARFEPESASGEGFDGYDEQVIDLGPDLTERSLRAYRDGEVILSARLARESDPAVRADLELLLQASQLHRERIELDEKWTVPFVDVANIVFRGLSVLLDDSLPEARRRAAVVRLRRYAGMTAGQHSIVDLAIQRTRERLDRPGLVFPAKARVEKVLTTMPIMTEGVGKLLKKYAIPGYEEPLARWNEQVAAYTKFVRENILPRARLDFRQPPELYRLALKEAGIDAPPREVAAKAREAFTRVQREMQELAPRVAREKGLSVTDYRDVIRALKKTQLEGDDLLATYRRRIPEIEAILRREHLITVPARAMQIRLATDAESARVPAPFFNSPRIIGNTGEQGEFVLPKQLAADPSKRLDDFSYEAASWWLTAHEGRPGHELQYSTMIERKISIARAIFAFNSVNAEGWGLYAEDMMRPYMPLDGQLICLQARLMRAAHAFLDIELNLGLIGTSEAHRVMHEEAVFSEAWTNSAVERYTFWWPAQAPSYFYGYMRLMELRADAQKAMGKRFDLAAFHDFVLAQGLVPPPLLRKAVFADLVKQTG